MRSRNCAGLFACSADRRAPDPRRGRNADLFRSDASGTAPLVRKSGGALHRRRSHDRVGPDGNAARLRAGGDCARPSMPFKRPDRRRAPACRHLGDGRHLRRALFARPVAASSSTRAAIPPIRSLAPRRLPTCKSGATSRLPSASFPCSSARSFKQGGSTRPAMSARSEPLPPANLERRKAAIFRRAARGSLPTSAPRTFWCDRSGTRSM